MTIKRVALLQELLGFVGLEGRLHLEWISSAEAQKFVQVVTAFTKKIQAMGPSPVSDFTEKIEAFLGPKPVRGTGLRRREGVEPASDKDRLAKIA